MFYVLRFVYFDRYFDFEVVLVVFGGVYAVLFWLTVIVGGYRNYYLYSI